MFRSTWAVSSKKVMEQTPYDAKTIKINNWWQDLKWCICPVILWSSQRLCNPFRQGEPHILWNLLQRYEWLSSARHYLAGTKPRTSHHRSPGWGERRRMRKRSIILLERTNERKGHRQSDPTLELFQGQHYGETPERRGGAHNYGPSWAHRYHLELNWTELNWTEEHCV